MILDQIIQDDRARLPMKENDLFDERVPSKWDLFEIVCPGPRRCVRQDADEFQVPLFQCKRRGFRRPQLRVGELRVPFCQSPNVPRSRGHMIFNRLQCSDTFERIERNGDGRIDK